MKNQIVFNTLAKSKTLILFLSCTSFLIYSCGDKSNSPTPVNNGNTGTNNTIITPSSIKDTLQIYTDTLKSSVAALYKSGSVVQIGVGILEHYAVTSFEYKDPRTGRTLGVVLNGQIPSELNIKIEQGVKTAPRTYTAPKEQPFEIIGRRTEKDMTGSPLSFSIGVDKYRIFKLTAKVIITPFDDFPVSAKALSDGFKAFVSSPDNTFDGALQRPYLALRPKATLDPE